MISYNPQVQDMRGQYVMQAANTQAQMYNQLGQDIGGALVGLAGSLAGGYMKKKEMESAVKAGDQMINMFGDQLGITTEKLKGFGYNDMSLDDKYAMHQNLWGNLGALSNMRMANARFEQAPIIQAQRDTAATDRMYEAERLRRERDAMNTPQAPAPITVPTGMRRFNANNP